MKVLSLTKTNNTAYWDEIIISAYNLFKGAGLGLARGP